RIQASELGLTQQDVSGSVLVSLSSTTQVSPNFWVNPQNRVNYRVAVQTPEHRVHSMDTLLNTPIINGQTTAAPHPNLPPPGGGGLGGGGVTRQPPPQLLSNLVGLRRSISPANVNHYNAQPVYDVYANVQGRDLAAVAADVQKAIDAVRADLP